MFQPKTNALDGVGAVMLAGPYSAASLKRARPRSLALNLADLDLLVDLGDAIGSKPWWRGLGTLGGLIAATLAVGLRAPALPTPMHPALSEAQIPLTAPAAIKPLALGATTGSATVPTNRVIPLAEAPERPRIEVEAKLRAVDSVAAALRRAGVGGEEVATITGLLGQQITLNGLKPGTSFDLVLGRRETKAVPRPLEHLSLRAAFDLKLEVARAAPGEPLALARIPIKVDNTPLHVTGTVGSSLYKSARASGVPATVVANYIKQLGHSLDFQRDVKASDRFDIVLEHRRAETGETETGGLLYAALDMGRKKLEMLRFAPTGGTPQFFNGDAGSVKRGLMKTPIDGARMSSGFGMRWHPILGYSRMHKGIDFAAGPGTPIMAAASGTIVYAGVYRGYGNHVRIRHANGIETSYSHMSRYANGARVGAKVEQGQVIGYVGSTGLSTGPHLHYEVYLRGQAVDPRSAKLPTGYLLAGRDRERFMAELARMRALRVTGPDVGKGLASAAKSDTRG